MHNNIMAAGSRDCPPMLATGRYAQWQSRFMRYVDTKPNGEALRKCILQGPYKLSNIIILGQPATDESLEVPKRTVVETFSNIFLENKAHYDAEKEAIYLLLIGIRDEIYSTDVNTSLFWEFGRFTSRDGELIESYYSRFVTIVKQTVDLDKESYHKLFDIFKQYQKEVNEIHTEKIAKNANPFALVVATQQYPDTYYQAPKPHRSYALPAKTSPSTRSHATTRHKGKEIAKPIKPPSELASEKDSDPEQAQRDKKMQKNLALIETQNFFKLYKPTNNNLRTSLNSRNKNVETVGTRVVQQTEIQCFNCKEFGYFAKECRKPKGQKITLIIRKRCSCANKLRKEVLPTELGSDAEPLEKVQYDAEYNVFANERQHSEQPGFINDTYTVEKDDSSVIPDSSNMCNNDNQANQNVEECDDEHVVLANLIANLKLDTDEHKKIQKQLKKANTSLSHELRYELKKLIEKCKGKSVETKFDKPYVVRQPNAQRIPKPSVLGKPTPFSDSLKRKSFSKTKSVTKTNVSEGLSKPVTTQILPQTASQAVRNTNVIKPGMYQIDTLTSQTRAPQLSQTFRNTNPRVSTSTGVIHNTSVSIPQLRSTQMKEKVMHNNSQVKFKKTEVEEHHRISSIYNKTKSVTACNDNLKVKTSNVNLVCATCGKCVFNSNHDACVSKFLNDVNARSKKPQAVPIRPRKPIRKANQSVTTPPKKTVAFRKSTCFVRDLHVNDLLTGNRGSDIYTISLQDTTSPTLICFLAKASPTQACLWHRRLSHLNFDTINLLSKKDIVNGLPKLKYVKDKLCSSCELSKAKRSTFKTKIVPSSKGRLNLLHMDLCGPMRIKSINGKKYILVIVDDYS
ncbi:retrovirus-related pol polyprotein from transposon TNT 1-94 [Tanacetum coccineum]